LHCAFCGRLLNFNGDPRESRLDLIQSSMNLDFDL
jgi:hypothetical protein